MADVAKRLVGPSAMGTSTVTLYTVPSATTTILRHIRVANTTAGALTFKMSIGADAAGTRLYSDLSIPANDVFAWTGFEVMTATETLRGHASASGLTVTVSGVEST